MTDTGILHLAWLIPLFPLAGFIITGAGRKRLPAKASGWIASAAVMASFVLSLLMFFRFTGGAAPAVINLFDWISAGSVNLPAEFLVDRLSVFMLLIITGVGSAIHVYSIGYMKGDEGFSRFFSFMNLFIFFMTLLVLGGSYLIMFAGWEGVGLYSYLLIGFWYSDHENNDAAKKAFIMNRIGDAGFILGMFLIFFTFGSLSFRTVFAGAAAMTSGAPVLTAITLLLFAGATGKSAQIPLFTWLPDAMAGPTPVSALIHAATMVTAGIYMIARSGILYAMAPVTMLTVSVTGLLTSVLAAVIALFQNDIKKVLAYSTISQLGLMFLSLGTGAFTPAMFHLMTHAFFKALLFLAAGSIIHSIGGIQDLRKMGGLRKTMPVTFTVFLVAALSVSGIPPFAGFFSKDEILLSLFGKSPLLWTCGLIISVLTAFYTFRIFFLAFSGDFRGDKDTDALMHESPAIMTLPLSILALLAFAGGLPGMGKNAGKSIIEDFFRPVFNDSQAILSQGRMTDSHSGTLLVAGTVLAVIASVAAAWYFFSRRQKVPPDDSAQEHFVPRLIRKKLCIDEIYDTIAVKPVMRLSAFLQERVDMGIIDRSVEFAGRLVMKAGNRIRYLQTGNTGFYLFAMVLCILAVLFFNIFIK